MTYLPWEGRDSLVEETAFESGFESLVELDRCTSVGGRMFWTEGMAQAKTRRQEWSMCGEG